MIICRHTTISHNLDQKLTFLVINGVYDPTPLFFFEKF